MDGTASLNSQTAPGTITIGLIEHLGDIVACEPVARYLKLNHPSVQLSWVVRSEYRELIDSNPYIDETVIVTCLTDWMKLSSHSQVDRIVDLHVNYRVCQHCRIPLVKQTGNPFVTAHDWFDYGSLLEAFSLGAGLPRLRAQPRVYLGPEHAKAIDELCLPPKYAVIHRRSNDRNKDWIDEGWFNVAQELRKLGYAVVEVGTGSVESLPQPIGDSINLCNRLPILQTAEVIRRAGFFMGVDSGPAHLANALRVPGVVLLGKLAYFDHYSPFAGFYAEGSALVKLVRNLVGNAADLRVGEVIEAVRYVAAMSECLPQDRAVPQHVHWERRAWGAPEMPQARAILDSGLFDMGWYLVHNPETERAPMHPADHYMLEGAARGLSPGSDFDFNEYQSAEHMVEQGINPVLHYLDSGVIEGRVLPISSKNSAPNAGGNSVEKPGQLLSTLLDLPAARAGYQANSPFPRTFAFYLPQFHPIMENDWAHGPGFSEWHNVIKAKPLFRGHHQPRLPGELGFYDLRSEEVLHRQIDLAQEHGISGFCFYYYHFQGRKLLYKPLANFLSSSIKAPFLCLWANENWTKRWDGGDSQVIISQTHSDEDDRLIIHNMLELFSDNRYLKIDGKPVFMVYKPQLFPEIRRTVDLWRKQIVQYGFRGIYLVMVDDWMPDAVHPRSLGFDAAYEIPSNIVPGNVMVPNLDEFEIYPGFDGRIVDYTRFSRFHMSRPVADYKRFRTVMLPWDNTARYGPRAMVQVNGQTDAYKQWLLSALLDTHRQFPPQERIVFVHSWNEWCEGTYLEPDARNGRFFLEQTREAVSLAREVIDQAGRYSLDAAVDLLNVQKAKDAGALLVMHATRMQVHYAWRDLTEERQQRVRLTAELAALRHQIALMEPRAAAESEVRARLDAVENSTSWRITGPLRRAVRLLRS
jgi:ADP-heptose:LPS heptosyltransferase